MKSLANSNLKFCAVVCSVLCIVPTIYVFAVTAALPDGFLEWLCFLGIHIPFVIVAVAALMAPCGSLLRPILLLAGIFALVTTAMNYAALHDTRPGWDDQPLVGLLWLLAPLEFLFALWALGAVLVERRRSSHATKHPNT
jgi:hypothetical protein